MEKTINPNIFKAYDIRGVYPEEINEEAAYKIGQASVEFFNAKKIMVARDIRLSSKPLSDALINGIISQGADVIDIGLASTPYFYYSLAVSPEADAGFMITASHMSKEFNGMKPMFKKSVPFTKEQILEFKKDVLEKDFIENVEKGKIELKDLTEKYIREIKNFIKAPFKPLKVVVDSGNGMAGLYFDKIFTDSNIEIIPLFMEPDGTFPNHTANPRVAENRQYGIEKMKEVDADLGIFFDGDADRFSAVNRNGELIDPSLLIAIISEYLIKGSSRNGIAVEVKTSRVVKDLVKKLGGKLTVLPHWTIPLKLEMRRDKNIIFGGETSGHLMLADFYSVDDGILGFLIFLQALSVREETLEQIIDKFKSKYFTIEETNFPLASRDKIISISAELEEKYKKVGAKISKIDGLAVEFPDWWFTLIISESAPVMRLNLEANSKELLEEKNKELVDYLSQFAVEPERAVE
ncbi:MAG: phosphomannomutase/phosphoglucomutase [Parcubacteria group bacterium]|jgi:phosphomannomutase